MKILIAEDEYTTQLMVQVCLEKWGYSVESVADGKEAWNVLKQPTAPEIAILDWRMPGMEGVELCRRVKGLQRDIPIHVIMLTACNSDRDILNGFDAGADDYITKPFNDQELRARIRVAERSVRIQTSLSETLKELKEALDLVNALQNTVSICKQCKKIEGDDGGWYHLDYFIKNKENSRFVSVQCPMCGDNH